MNNYGGDISKRWYVDYWLDGTRQREWIPANPPDSREERAKKILQKFSKGVSVQARTRLANELFNLIKNEELRSKTISGYKTVINQFAEFLRLKGVTTASQIKESHAEAYHKSLKGKFANQTIKNKILALKAVFDRYKQNPFNGITVKRKNHDSDFNYPYSDYEREQISQYLIENDYRLYLLTRFIFYAFIRPKELRGLQVKHLDLRTKTIKIPREISKNKRSQVVPMIKPLYDLIIKERLTMHPPDCYLFGWCLNTGFQPQQANEATNRHRTALIELEMYRPRETVLYSWKHTGNISFYLQTRDLKLLQLMNRHAEATTTEIYLRKLGLFLNAEAFEVNY